MASARLVAGISVTSSPFGAIADANRDFVENVENIELGDDQRVETVDHRCVFEQRRVEPSAAPRASGNGAELISFATKNFAGSSVALSRKRSRADARVVRLRNANDARDPGGRNAGADRGSAGRRAGRSYKRIGAMVDVEQGTLRAFEQNALALGRCVGKQRRGIADHRSDSVCILLMLRADLGVVDGVMQIEGGGESLLILDQRVVDVAETFRVVKVGDADAAASSLILVAGTECLAK